VKRTTIVSRSYTNGQIVQQSRDAGTRLVPKGKTITLTVSVGANGFSLLDMTNWSQASVRQYANSMGFTLNLKYDYSAAVQAGSVMSQSPKAGTAVPHSAKITVVISRGSEVPE
jgi:serine/threonine-protein kinase